VDRWADQIRLVDVALLPEHRGSGLGTALLESLLAEGRETGLPVSIHVEYNNPALNLYRRLGFRHVDSNGIYYLMRWEPGEEGSEAG
jgi:ribosomal protein S18 acetylase RimI-like enzyme